MANYHIAITDTLRKSGYTSNKQRNVNGDWRRINGLKKQYANKGFPNAVLERIYTREDSANADEETLAVEQVTHVLMGAKGLHAGNQETHGDGWTEIFEVSQEQLTGYFGKAIQVCKRLNWDSEKIVDWLEAYCTKKFGVISWSEHCYGEPREHGNPLKIAIESRG